MDYFFSHIGYILIGGLMVSAICVIWSFAAMKWHKDLKESGEEHLGTCDKGCMGCQFMAKCGKERD